MTDAPYHPEICDGPGNGYALWRMTSDRVRLRIGLWPLEGAKETILIFTGRTEYIEKYAHIAADLQAAGYAVASLDWRGQGLSDRLLDDPYRGHVGDFGDYQKDIATLMETISAEGLPAPKAIVAHSMGGCIGLRALIEGLPVKGAVFSAPMWGIIMAPALRPVAWVVSRVAAMFGLGATLAPGTNARSFILNDPFQDNTLTRDAKMWKMMGDQIRAVPGLELGGPSLDWVRLAVDECAALMRAPAPDLPALTFLGDNERIVEPSAIHTKMQCWPKGTLEIINDGEHEGFMEGPEKRAAMSRQMIAFLDTL
ncbi:MAG: alpha/beta hydrolase [Planktotalea sp.]|uniref:alpha/beta fold hydrolase n=1 Tax=Planktotalea sp. TaxID=2029877 RepID=UPI003C7757BF